MKVGRLVFFGLVMAGTVVLLSGVSNAEVLTSGPAATPAAATNDVSAAKKAKQEAKIKLLMDSAAALQQTNPDLAMKLINIANGVGKEEPLPKDSPEWKKKHEARMQLYVDSATALQATHPDLANGLIDLMVPKQKTETQKATEEKNEKEEAGEKAEPKSEQ